MINSSRYSLDETHITLNVFLFIIFNIDNDQKGKIYFAECVNSLSVKLLNNNSRTKVDKLLFLNSKLNKHFLNITVFQFIFSI